MARSTSTSDLPALKKTEKHDIDVVIDRVKVRPDLQQRLAESFEAALRVGGHDGHGRVLALEMDTGRSTCSAPSLPARCAAIRWASWSRACSRSTRPWAPARPATAWASARCSTRRAWWPSPA
jgi:excinuclease UvrABC ATPase subunit